MEEIASSGRNFYHTVGNHGFNRTMAWRDMELFPVGPVAWTGTLCPQPLVRIDEKALCAIGPALADNI